MKKTTKSNPLKFFNDNKSMAYKKAGGQMSTYKIKLKKAKDGIETNDYGEDTNMMIDKPGSTGGYKKSRSILAPPEGMNIPPISPYMSESNLESNLEWINEVRNMNRVRNMSKDIQRSGSPKTTKAIVAGKEMEFTPEQMKSIFGIQKKGGSIGRKK